jgi:hypothetical protein
MRGIPFRPVCDVSNHRDKPKTFTDSYRCAEVKSLKESSNSFRPPALYAKKTSSPRYKSWEEVSMPDNIMVFDCDGHIIESIPEMALFLDPVDREVALTPSRNRQGVFASLDDIH